MGFYESKNDQREKDGEESRLFYKWGGMRRTCEGSMFGAKEKGTRGRADFRQKIFRGNVRRTARRARREPSNHVAPTKLKPNLFAFNFSLFSLGEFLVCRYTDSIHDSYFARTYFGGH